MTYTIPVIQCDRCNIRIQIESATGLKDVRLYAKENHGWAVHKSPKGYFTDYCPNCEKKYQENKKNR